MCFKTAHKHREKSQTLSSGYMPVALTLSSLASLTTHADIHTHFQGDLVTFPVCPILPLSMLSVSSPMPSRLELPLPQARIRTAVPGQQETLASAPSTDRRSFTTFLRKQRQ